VRVLATRRRWEWWTSRCYRGLDPSSPARRRLMTQLTAGRGAGTCPTPTRSRRCRRLRRPPQRDLPAAVPSPCTDKSPHRSCSATPLSGIIATPLFPSSCKSYMHISSFHFDLLWRKRESDFFFIIIFSLKGK
jgi:hypothetical protein